MKLLRVSLAALLLSACGGAGAPAVTPKMVITDILTADQIACVVEQAAAVVAGVTIPPDVVALQCKVLPALLPSVEALLGASAKGIGAARAKASAPAK